MHTKLINVHNCPEVYPVVIKPIDGVAGDGCYLIDSVEEYLQLLEEQNDHQQMIVQPYIAGTTLSLSALFSNGKGRLLSCNEQKTELINQQFKLQECRVNILPENRELYQCLVEQIADAIPELWGYAGIDCVATEAGPVVLEINPRLTTSYAGLSEALDLNTAKIILGLLEKQVGTHITIGKPITVKIHKEGLDAA